MEIKKIETQREKNEKYYCSPKVTSSDGFRDKFLQSSKEQITIQTVLKD